METTDPNCGTIRPHLPAWLSGQLPEAEHAALATHLATCPACQREEAALRQLWHGLGSIATPEPGEQVRPRFYAMLAEFEAETRRETWTAKLQRLWQQLLAPDPALRLAYSILLLVGGLAIGYGLRNQSSSGPAGATARLAANGQASQEQQMVLTMLENPSATQRLQAVSQTRDIAQVNQDVVNALLSTLNNDENVNVRLATLDALAQLGHDPVVRKGLVRSLTMQESPLVQSALADVMVQLQVHRSVPPLRQLLKQTDLNEAVKTKIETSIQTLSNGQSAASSPNSSHENASETVVDTRDTVAL